MLTAAYLVTKQNPEGIWAASIEAPPIAIHPGSRGSSTAFQAPNACHPVIDSVPVGACSRPRAKLSCAKLRSRTGPLKAGSIAHCAFPSIKRQVRAGPGQGSAATTMASSTTESAGRDSQGVVETSD